jgi:purine-binding chemotaxis protein CheW
VGDSQAASRSFVLFRLGDEEFGLPVTSVVSIIRYEQPTNVPRASAAVLGVINLRGRVIPVLDLRLRFTGVPFVPSPMSRIIVAEGLSGALGVAVDAASEVTTFSEDAIKVVPEGVVGAEAARAFSGMIERSGGLVMLLDLEEALPRVEYAGVALTDERVEEERNA